MRVTFRGMNEARTWHGTPVVPGVTHGPALVVTSEIAPEAVARFRGLSLDAAAALAAYDDAVTAVSTGLSERATGVSGAAAEVLKATAGLVRDKGLRKSVDKNLQSGKELLDAVDAAVEQFVGMFTTMGGLMAERVADLRDIRTRLTARLVGEPEPGIALPEVPSVVVAEDLAPADTAVLDATRVLALVTEKGGPTSHTAIIARQLGLPCVVATAGIASVAQGTLLLVDGTTGEVRSGVAEEEAGRLVDEDRVARAVADSWTGPGSTRDGVAVKVLANVANGAGATKADEAPVEGVGLFRTELCFLDRKDEPSVEEQAALYADVLRPFADRYVVVRTLDAGSDKPIPFASLADEENPALGVRGLRLSFDNAALLERQLDAIALAAKETGTETWVMAPMVATVAEAADFAGQVRARGLKPGVMVEVPSAALLADRVLEVVDFLSIGTNDLTQYAMAADRQSPQLAHLTDPWQPAVLQLIALTARAGQAAGKPVGVCGEAAADPLLAAVLVGMGVSSLSMAAAAVRPVGAQLGAVDHAACGAAAEVALKAPDPQAARIAARTALGL